MHLWKLGGNYYVTNGKYSVMKPFARIDNPQSENESWSVETN